MIFAELHFQSTTSTKIYRGLNNVNGDLGLTNYQKMVSDDSTIWLYSIIKSA